MLHTIATSLLIFGLLGFFIGYTFISFVHILLAVSVLMILIHVITGRRSSLM